MKEKNNVRKLIYILLLSTIVIAFIVAGSSSVIADNCECGRIIDFTNPLTNVDGDTTSWSTNDAMVDLGVTEWTIMGQGGLVSAYDGKNVGDLTHRGTRGLGIKGGSNNDEIDVISQDEELYLIFDTPKILSKFEVRSLFDGEGPLGEPEQADVEVYLDDVLVQTYQLYGEDVLGSDVGDVQQIVPDILFDELKFYISDTNDYYQWSEFAVAKIWFSSADQIWVDDDYTEIGPNDGHAWGYDAFSSIQDAVDCVNECGTITVEEGIYEESITVTKSMNIIAPNGAVIKCPATPSNIQIPESTNQYEYDVAFLGGYNTGISSIIGDDFAPISSSWLAKARHGGAGGYRMELGMGPGNRDELYTGGSIPWNSGSTYHFTLDWDDITGQATFVVNPGGYTCTYTVPSGGNAISILGSTAPDTSKQTIIDNVVFNGDQVSPDDGFTIISDGSIIKKHLLITGVDLSDSFTLEGDFTFTYDSPTNDEAPKIQIDIGTVTDPTPSWTSETITIEFAGFTLDADEFIPSQRWSTILCRNVNDDHCDELSWIHDNILVNNYVNGKETFGILGYGNMDIIIEDNVIDQFARGGIGLYSGYAEVTGNTVIGPGLGVPVTWAPNGIQFGYGAFGLIEGNDVSGCGWPGTDWAGTGVMVVDTSNVIVEDNLIHNNEQGCSVVDYPSAYGPPWDANVVSDISVLDNDFESNEWGLAITNDASNIVVEYNRFWDTTYDAIDVYAYDLWYSWYMDPAPSDVVINHNWIRHELCDPAGVGLWVGDTVSDVVDARFNYWGQDDGPSGETVDIYTGRLADDIGGEEVQGINVSFDEYAGVCADFSVSDSTPTAGDPVVFDASASYAVDIHGDFYEPDSFQWDVYRNGLYQFTNFGEVATLVFPSSGVYKVRLRVQASDAELNYWGDTSGSLLDDAYLMISVSSRDTPDPLTVDACPDEMVNSTLDRYDGEVDGTIQFFSVVAGGVPGYEYNWDFGDGSVSTIQNPTHVFTVSGEFEVSLTVVDSDGRVASDETIAVIINSENGAEDPDDEELPVRILAVDGGFGLYLDIWNPKRESIEWSIDINGNRIFFGESSYGTVSAQSELTISTGFSFGFGDIEIVVRVDDLSQHYSARMFGPFILDINAK